MSEVIPMAALATALAKANQEIQNPAFDRVNPHFRSKFASLAAVRNAVLPVYGRYGLSVLQDLQTTESGAVACYTHVLHESGAEKVFGPFIIMPTKSDPQGMCAAGTYAKRAHFQAVACVVGDEDDDGNEASGKPGAPEEIKKGSPKGVTTVDPRGDMAGKADPKTVADYAKRFRAAMDQDKEENQIAADVYAIHLEVASNHELYIDIGNALPSKYKNALRDYVDIHKQLKKAS